MRSISLLSTSIHRRTVNRLTVNGMRIETNKNGLSVVNHMITFGDGSTYDSRTGIFRNMGPGYVKVNGNTLKSDIIGDSSNDDPVTTKSQYFIDATSLSLVISTSDALVETHDQPGIRVEIHGPVSAVETIKLDRQGSNLLVSDHGSGGGVNSVVISGRGNISIMGRSVQIGNMSIGGGKSSPTITVRVYVPVGTEISASASTNAHIDINGVNGSLDLDASTSGRIYVTKASGDLRIDATTSAKVRVDLASVDKLKVEASTSGKVTVTGTAVSAKLSASTSGRVDVDHVINTPRKIESTSGRVRVSRVG